MCNCRDKRVHYSDRSHSHQKGLTKVKYIGQIPFKVYGNVTGRRYKFSKINETIIVDRRDALELIKSKDFLFS